MAAWASVAIIAVGGGVTGVLLATSSHPSSSAAAAKHRAPHPAPPLRLVAVSPGSGSRGVDGADDITVTFNEPLPATAALPQLSPAIAGAWQREGNTVVFTPQTGFTARTRDAFSSLANTGISIAPTPVGTFPVYEKLQYQVMSGTNPDGSHYADPVQWVSYFEGGSAVHYIARGSYGSPQSLGCVELPYTAAQEAYPILPYGTLVTVT